MGVTGIGNAKEKDGQGMKLEAKKEGSVKDNGTRDNFKNLKEDLVTVEDTSLVDGRSGPKAQYQKKKVHAKISKDKIGILRVARVWA